MIFLVDALALLEIWWDWRLIERKQRSPNYRGSNQLRFVVGLVVWINWPLMVEVSHAQWLFSPVMMAANFWFIFDYGLNKARKKELMHLGTNRIDTFQREHGGEKRWFWIKAALAAATIILYYVCG